MRLTPTRSTQTALLTMTVMAMKVTSKRNKVVKARTILGEDIDFNDGLMFKDRLDLRDALTPSFKRVERLVTSENDL